MRVSSNCTCLRTAVQYCCLTITSSSIMVLPVDLVRCVATLLYATRSSRTSIVANVMGQSDTHHGGNGVSVPHILYFNFFQRRDLVGQVGHSLIDGLAQFLSQHFPQRL